MKSFKEIKSRLSRLFRRNQNQKPTFSVGGHVLRYNKPQIIGKIETFGKLRYRIVEFIKSEKLITGKTKLYYRVNFIY